MNLTDLQKNVTALVAANPTFSASAAVAVFADLGFSKPAMEKSLDFKAGGAGWAIAVWPPLKGKAMDEYAGQTGVDCTIAVRLEVNPQKLKDVQVKYAANNALPDAGQYLAGLIKSVVAAVISAPPEDGGVRFALSSGGDDAIELMNFDEGLIAYHVRFDCFAVLGT
jgi:hypothetical protein